MTKFVIYKRHLAKINLEKELLSALEDKIKGLSNYQELRLNPEMVLLCCNIIENSVLRKDKVHKKDLAVRLLNSVFNYSVADKKAVEEQIDFLHSNKRIKKINFFRKCWMFLGDWVERKLL